MSHALRKAARMLAVLPLTGLVLAGCGGGGSDGGSAALRSTTGVQETTGQPAATAESTERYDINVVMVCDAVDDALAQVGDPDAASTQQFRSALRKSLNRAFRSSTTPQATLTGVRVDRLLNQGCPGSRAKALIGADVAEISDLGR